MSTIDKEVLAMFNALSPTRQGQLLDVLGRLTEEQRAQQPLPQAKEQTAEKKPPTH
jgi:hypothetical protein